jgi:hypothetical protein
LSTTNEARDELDKTTLRAIENVLYALIN